MTKYLIISLVVVLVIGALYFTFFSSFNKMLFSKTEVPTPTVSPKTLEIVVRQKTPTPTPIPDPEADLTALEKDLADLDKSNLDLTKDINNL